MRLFTERTGDGAGPVMDADNGEELLHIQEAISIVLGNRPSESPGTLIITSKQVIWLSDVDWNRGYAVDFVSISLHAVSRDPEAYPSPCIYAQIETGEDEDEEEEENEAESQTTNWSSGISNIKEIRLVPSDPSQLETLFEMFCEGAELNPEPMEDENEEEHNWIFSADQLNIGDLGEEEHFDCDSAANNTNSIGHSNGDHDLVHNVLQLQIDDQRFEDAEEMERERSSGHQ